MTWKCTTRLIAVFFLATSPHLAGACSAFLLSDDHVVLMAKNYDWHLGHGLLMINSSGVEKTALVADGTVPATWVSKFGSLTFNQYGREFPLGGMNDAGLAMEVLWLEATQYPTTEDRPAISTLQWVQHCLDRFDTVDQVVASSDELAVGGIANLHYLACDAHSACAVIEFLDGKAVVWTGRTLPVAALTNNSYRSSLVFLNASLGYGGAIQPTEGQGSLQRFARAAGAVNRFRDNRSETPEGAAFAVLADVAQTGPSRTQWSIIYDLAARRVHFKTASRPDVRTVDLRALDLTCISPTLMLDLGAKQAGEVTADLRPYDPQVGIEVLEASYSGTEFLKEIPEETVEEVAAYPEGLVCTIQAESESGGDSAP